MIVVDASVVVEVLLRSDAGAVLEERLLDGDDPLHAPHMLDVEVAHALRRCALHGDIDGRSGRDSLGFLAAMSIERHGHQPLLERRWQLRHNLTGPWYFLTAVPVPVGGPVRQRFLFVIVSSLSMEHATRNSTICELSAVS